MTTATATTLSVGQLRLLGTLLSGDGLERISDEIADPGCIYSPGGRILLAGELRLLADYFECTGKTAALDIVRGGVGASAIHADAGVVFEYKAPGDTTRVDEPELRHQYPPDDYPSLYKSTPDTTAVRKALPPKDAPSLYTTSRREERVDVKV